MITLNALAVAVIAVWAFWCMLSKNVKDGIIGKVLYLMLMLAALGVLSSPGPSSNLLLNTTFAALAIRHAWMKKVFPRLLEYFIEGQRK